MQSKSLAAAALLFAFTHPATGFGADFDEARIEREALTVLDEFMASFNARDPEAHTATYHFPHYRLARGSMNSWETADAAVQAHVEIFESLPDTGWHRSTWLQRRIVTVSETKVHVDTRFRRLRKDGSVIGSYDSLYILIKRDGRWGIKMRSSFL